MSTELRLFADASAAVRASDRPGVSAHVALELPEGDRPGAEDVRAFTSC